MKQEEKELLLKDLCARLPYGVKVHVINDGFYDAREPYDTLLNIKSHHLVVDLFREQGPDAILIQPYLRPIESITEEEYKELTEVYNHGETNHVVLPQNDERRHATLCMISNGTIDEWLNAHHFDYRGLIPMGLALEAPADMYKTK